MKHTKRTIIEHRVELPELVEDLALPAGLSIDAWEKIEKKRLTREFETIKGGTAVLGPEIQEAFEELRRETAFWDVKRRLLNLKILEAMGYAENAAGETEDDTFAVRRMYGVAEHPVSDYVVNAIWPK